VADESGEQIAAVCEWCKELAFFSWKIAIFAERTGLNNLRNRSRNGTKEWHEVRA
jgi:hypothetical protein